MVRASVPKRIHEKLASGKAFNVHHFPYDDAHLGYSIRQLQSREIEQSALYRGQREQYLLQSRDHRSTRPRYAIIQPAAGLCKQRLH